ncbi:hypothetical protein scyTo_0012511 [Scyliorhinus torazame]|uniref:Uncharacterized protein n=1 Tax=Scyliorhinus torazame TaxID=75743 RepID=A0A401PA01_SCYTO|nr:hypothetical protein [Scyliorhinus torazame]
MCSSPAGGTTLPVGRAVSGRLEGGVAGAARWPGLNVRPILCRYCLLAFPPHPQPLRRCYRLLSARPPAGWSSAIRIHPSIDSKVK